MITRSAPVWAIQCAQFSLLFSCFFVPLSTALMNIAYFSTILLSLCGGKQVFSKALRNPASILISLVTLLYFMGSFYSIAPLRDIIDGLRKHSWLFCAPLLLGLPLSMAWRRYALNAFLLAVGIVLVLSYLKFWGLLSIGEKFTQASVFKNHISQNFLSAFACAIFAYRFLHYPNKWRYFYLIVALLTAYNVLFMSLGRTGYALFFLLLGIVILQYAHYKGLLLSLLIIGSLASFSYYYSASFKMRIKTVLSDTLEYAAQPRTISSMSIRYNEYQNTWKLMKQHPGLGYGTGSVRTAFEKLPALYPDATHISHRPAISNSTESVYLNILLQFGWCGLLIFVGVFGGLGWLSRYITHPEMRFVFSAYLISFLVGACATDWITTPPESRLLSLLCVLGLGGIRRTVAVRG